MSSSGAGVRWRVVARRDSICAGSGKDATPQASCNVAKDMLAVEAPSRFAKRYIIFSKFSNNIGVRKHNNTTDLHAATGERVPKTLWRGAGMQPRDGSVREP